MRILVASVDAIPGYSGGWATPLDLLQGEHEMAYAVKRGRPGSYELEGVRVRSVPRPLRLLRDWPTLNRLRLALASPPFRRTIARAFREHRADFVLCLNVSSARECVRLGLPYALRFHGAPSPTAPGELRELIEGAAFATRGPSVEIPGEEAVVPISHCVDLERFEYAEHPRAERVLMLSTLNPMRRPELFIRGVAMSGLRGTVVGDGILRREVERMCRETGGRVEYHEPVPRLALPGLLRRFQIGVACFRKVPLIYQMRVNEYMASGLYPLVMPWTHLAREAPELTRTFETPEELAELLDALASDWGSTLESRRRGRRFVLERYDIERPREKMRSILVDAFGSGAV